MGYELFEDQHFVCMHGCSLEHCSLLIDVVVNGSYPHYSNKNIMKLMCRSNVIYVS